MVSSEEEEPQSSRDQGSPISGCGVGMTAVRFLLIPAFDLRDEREHRPVRQNVRIETRAAVQMPSVAGILWEASLLNSLLDCAAFAAFNFLGASAEAQNLDFHKRSPDWVGNENASTMPAVRFTLILCQICDLTGYFT
jgi:hypothetical protein